MNPPYLIIGNHTNNWDPFLINAYVENPIHFVTSDEYFRRISTRYLLKYAGAIPKTKFMKDMAAVKEIIKRKNEGKIIGLFPEGRRNWDGKTGNIIYSSAKLIKLLKIPVVFVSLKGAYLSYPRWARYPRWGKINISFEQIFTPDEISKIGVQKIWLKLKDVFSYNEYDYQRQEQNLYKGYKLAENLELFLFICPSCQEIATLKSTHDLFYCTNCGYQVIYNERGYFETHNTTLFFDNPQDWNHWQVSYLNQYIKNYKEDEALISDKDVFLYAGSKNKIKKKAKGNLLIRGDTLIFEEKSGKKYLFILDRTHGLNVQSNYMLDFFYKKKLYRFNFKNRNISAYKWLKVLEAKNNLK